MPFAPARIVLAIAVTALCTACAKAKDFEIVSTGETALAGTAVETFNQPWAMTFLPDGRGLVTEKGGAIWLTRADGTKIGPVTGGPSVTARGQGGLGDVIAHPDFTNNGAIYLSYAERDEADGSLSGAAVMRATLSLTDTGGVIEGGEVIWRQTPKVTGNGHYGHRMVFSPDGLLFTRRASARSFPLRRTWR